MDDDIVVPASSKKPVPARYRSRLAVATGLRCLRARRKRIDSFNPPPSASANSAIGGPPLRPVQPWGNFYENKNFESTVCLMKLGIFTDIGAYTSASCVYRGAGPVVMATQFVGCLQFITTLAAVICISSHRIWSLGIQFANRISRIC